MLCTQLISSRGAEVTVVDPEEWKAPLSRRSAAHQTGRSRNGALGHGELDIVIEAAGAMGSPQLAVDLVRRGGRVIVCGIAPEEDNVRSVDIVSKNVGVYWCLWRDPRRVEQCGG